jgi:DNA polymerase I
MNRIIVRTEEQLRDAERRLCELPIFGWDYETTGIRWYRHKVFMSSFASPDGTVWVIPFRHFPLGRLSFFHRQVLQSKGEVVAHNAKFELNHTRGTFGTDAQGRLWNVTRKLHDTMVMAHLLDENQVKALKPLAEKHLGIAPDERDAVHEWLREHHGNKENWRFEEVPEDIMLPYSGNDPYITLKLYEHFKPQIDRHFAPLYATEMHVLDILHRMEQNGLPIDVPYVQAKFEECGAREAAAAKKVLEAVGFEFNVDSDLELAEVLYDKLGLPVPGLTKEGQRSTDEDALESLNHPVPKLVIAYRKEGHRRKLFEGYRDLVDEKGVVQNPTKEDEILRMFIVERGWEAWIWDQSQIEMVGLAHYSGDPQMRAALRNGKDLHATTAAGIFGISYEEALADKVKRGVGKSSNFAMSFMVGKAKLAKFINGYLPDGSEITHEQAMAYKEAFQTAFPQLKRWAYKVIDTVREDRPTWGHHVKNTFGRVGRILPDKAYQGVNRVIQSWAADLMKASMVRIDKALGKPKWRQQVHDAVRIDLEADGRRKMEQVREVARCLTAWPEVTVPITCTVEKFTKNWAEVEKVKL